jgi:hypothetical protein
MARRDAGTMYSQGQAITASSQASTFYIDFFDQSHQIGQAVKVPMLHVKVNQTFTGANMNFLSIFFQDAQAAAGQTGPNATPGTFELTAIQILNIPKATLFAGNDILLVQVPNTGGLIGLASQPFQPDTLSDSPLLRFTQFLYTVDGIPATGSIDAWLDSF